MEQISKIRKCYHCGATIQCTDPEKEGYVLPEVFEQNINFVFCNKCFEAERYRATSNEPYIDEDFVTVLKEAKEKSALIVYVVDLYSFETSFSKEVLQYIEGMNILIVGTKYDLLPLGTPKDELSEYVAHRFRVAGLKVTHDDVLITSVTDEDSVREALTKIFELKNAKNVYVIGSNLSGKTALISAFLKIYANLSNGTISTHYYPGTNLKVMEIPLTNKSSMYETPGMSITNSFLFGLDAKTLKAITITKPVEARKITLSAGHSVFIGGLAIIEQLSGDNTDILAYFPKNVELNKNHVHNVEEKFIKLISRKELVPSLSKIKTTLDMEVFEIEMKEGSGAYRDIGFTGLGWITIKSTNQKFKIYLPKGVSIYSSRPKIKVK